jgi:hypothetical protein
VYTYQRDRHKLTIKDAKLYLSSIFENKMSASKKKRQHQNRPISERLMNIHISGDEDRRCVRRQCHVKVTAVHTTRSSSMGGATALATICPPLRLQSIQVAILAQRSQCPIEIRQVSIATHESCSMHNRVSLVYFGATNECIIRLHARYLQL